jgi:hypothetical protein
VKLHTRYTLRDLQKKLDDAQADPALRCSVARVDAKSRAVFHVEKPRAKPPKLGKNALVFEYGTHGAGYLAIDAETGEVTCGACAGLLDATATPPEDSIEGKADALEAEAALKKAG